MPELCRESFPRTTNLFLCIQAEIVAIATDLAEFVGAAIGLNLLFGIGRRRDLQPHRQHRRGLDRGRQPRPLDARGRRRRPRVRGRALASGLSSSSVGTYANQVVMQGFIRRRIAIVVRRLVTMTPALVVLALGLPTTDTLVISQVVPSFGIPFALVPLILFTRRADLMGALVNRRAATVAASVVAAVIIALNVFLIGDTLLGETEKWSVGRAQTSLDALRTGGIRCRPVSVEATPAVPITATGTQPRNYHGQVIAITVFSTIKLPGRIFLPILFGVTRRIPKLTVTLRQLSFIHFARWSVINKLPYNGPPQKKARWRYPHMYFESNFNGGWEEYIDAFSHILTNGMTAFWGTSYGFPKPLPTAPFKKYIQDNETEADHYWCAYPEATNTMIRRALELDSKLAALKRNAERMSPDEFAAAYRAFLTDAQNAL